ncbi:hypothetical protein ACLOJK_040871 [Asimina triloba]
MQLSIDSTDERPRSRIQDQQQPISNFGQRQRAVIHRSATPSALQQANSSSSRRGRPQISIKVQNMDAVGHHSDHQFSSGGKQSSHRSKQNLTDAAADPSNGIQAARLSSPNGPHKPDSSCNGCVFKSPMTPDFHPYK